MEHIRLTAISLSLLLCTVSAFAQRHYENIPALELNYGTNLFGNAGNYYNLSFPRYINRTSYWKAGFSYFAKWFIEGDIKGFFDNIDHNVLISILRERISDERFLRLIRKFFNAGYVEDWKYNKTYSGTPQGGIISPILAPYD